MYTLSPFEQKAFAKTISHGVPNMIRRMRESVLYVVPRMYEIDYMLTNWLMLFVVAALALGYIVYDQTEKLHQKLMRKNPADFENDQ